MKMEFKRLSYKHKNNKILYYIVGFLRMLTPSFYFRKRLKGKLNYIHKLGSEKRDRVNFRINYYNKLQSKHSLTNAIQLEDFTIKDNKKVYFFDFYEYTRYFAKSLRVKYLFGDITEIPDEPTFVKSRPISESNKNSILLKWNKVRHFIYIKGEKKEFRQKKDMLVFRGRVRSSLSNRVEFLNQYFNHPMCDIGGVDKRGDYPQWKVNRMTITEQLEYKFILSLEGNDVASNLKWIMSSKSLAVMPKPKFETWFMEGTLIPDHHYVLIKDDFSDLESKLKFYLENPDKAEEIIKNANEYALQFKDKKVEDLISLSVIHKYFDCTDQL